jgi:hypothetical protein
MSAEQFDEKAGLDWYNKLIRDFNAKDTTIDTLRGRVAKLEAALTKIRDNDPDSWEASVARAALKDKP